MNAPWLLDRRSWLACLTLPLLARCLPAGAAVLQDADAKDPFPLSECPVCGTPLEAKTIVVQGPIDIPVCSKDCADSARQNMGDLVRTIEKRIIEQQLPFYPLTTCVVDDTKLGEGVGFNHVFRNRLFRLCSEDCRIKLEAEPADYFELLNEAVIKKQKATYPLTTCLVSDQPLGADAVDYVVANQLVRLAQESLKAKFNRQAGLYMEKLREARQAAKK